MAPPPIGKISNRGKRSTESVRTVSSLGSVSTSRYNLRSQGPPNYEKFADSECPICLEDYSSPTIVNCGHSFCNPCIMKCIANDNFEICPVCKKKLVHQLFIESKDFTKRIQKRDPRDKSLSIAAQESVVDGRVSSSTKQTRNKIKSLRVNDRRTVH